jgi:hypothetical protein
MVDRALSETLEAQQGFAGCLAEVADCLQAVAANTLDAFGKSNAIERRGVRLLRCRVDQMPFTHFLQYGLPPSLRCMD